MEDFSLKSKEDLDLKIEIASKNDSHAFEDIILEQLTTDPQAFRSDLANLKNHYQRTHKDWRDELAGNKKFYVVAKKDNLENGIVGIGGALHKNDGSWHVVSVYTRPNFRNNGIAQKVLSLLLDEIKKRGGSMVTLNVNKDGAQEVARRIYEKMGFSVLEERTDSVGSYYFMCRELK